jgi:hypothetical protein
VNQLIDTTERDVDDVLGCNVSDQDLEIAAGSTMGAQAGSSLWSTVSVAGCTCIGE